ncbi:copper-binding protein [Cupriavidus sp. CP313]
MNMKSSASMASPKPVEAEVGTVDVANGKVTPKHGPIEKFGMSAMTMSFPVKDKASLSKLKEGDKVVNGAATVIRIEPR